jgi:hypothetical protein
VLYCTVLYCTESARTSCIMPLNCNSVELCSFDATCFVTERVGLAVTLGSYLGQDAGVVSVSRPAAGIVPQSRSLSLPSNRFQTDHSNHIVETPAQVCIRAYTYGVMYSVQGLLP